LNAIQRVLNLCLGLGNPVGCGYVAVVGPNTVWRGDKTIKYEDIESLDGSSNKFWEEYFNPSKGSKTWIDEKDWKNWVDLGDYDATLRLLERFQKKGIEYFTKLAGKFTVDEKCPGKLVIGLNLNSCEITDEELIHLRNFKSLLDLDLGGTKVTDAGLVIMEEVTHLRNLWLNNTKVTQAGIDKFQKLFPNCMIHWDGE